MAKHSNTPVWMSKMVQFMVCFGLFLPLL